MPKQPAAPSGMTGMTGKARSLLTEGRVRILSLTRNAPPSQTGDAPLREVTAAVKGSSDEYVVNYQPGSEGWRCACPARGLCSHIFAVTLVAGLY